MDRFPILGAVTGILLTLLMDGASERFVPFNSLVQTMWHLKTS